MPSTQVGCQRGWAVGAPDDLELGHRTQVRLASGDLPSAESFAYWFHEAQQDPHPVVHDESGQQRLLAELAALTGA